jgi:hypothetical protein
MAREAAPQTGEVEGSKPRGSSIGGFSSRIFFEFLTLPPSVSGRYLIEEARELNLDNENGRTRLLTG